MRTEKITGFEEEVNDACLEIENIIKKLLIRQEKLIEEEK